MKEGKKLLQKHELCTKRKFHPMNFLDKGKNYILDFWEEKQVFFNTESW